jgi:hypothetical protein
MHPAIVDARCDVDSLQPSKEICTTHDMFCFVVTGTMYTNLLGAFPVCSFKSMQYIFVAYIYDLNTILVHAMPSKNNAAMITTLTKILATLAARGYKPTLNVTDNKCSKMGEAYIKSNKMDIHLVPPHNRQTRLNMLLPHSRNISSRGTRTAPYNCGMNFCTKLSSPSTFSISQAMIPENLPTRRSTAHMT